MGHGDDSRPTADRETLLARIAELEAALAASQARLVQAEAMAQEDPLTGVLNRRGFARELERAVAFRNRYGTSVSVLLFDIDGLKLVNDKHGHAAGDAMIVGVARALKRNLRVSDAVARLGGDEYGVLIWHADEAVAGAKAQSLQFMLDASSATWDGKTLPLCVSTGFAEITGEGGADAALSLADERLYADKRQRRVPRKVA